MKKAWDEVKSFMTVVMTIAYIYLTITGHMTQEFQTIYLMIVSFYFGTQAEKLKQYTVDKSQQENTINNDDNGVG
jgi:DMSO/TMAO reductase YedYZ heme-binding membrane subunit